MRGYDARHRMGRDRRSKVFLDTSDAEIAEEVAGRNGLAPRVTGAGSRHRQVVQADQSDLALLTARAELSGHEFFVQDRQLFFRPPADAQPPVLSLDVFADLTSFTPRLNLAESRPSVRSWNASQKQLLVGEPGAG